MPPSREEERNYEREYNRKHPWRRTLEGIKHRCGSTKHRNYKYYGGKGIKCRITSDEIRVLWFRDHASDMERPSIDRIDSDADYTFENCRFIELSLNAKIARLKHEICTVIGCGKKHKARGFCTTHYQRAACPECPAVRVENARLRNEIKYALEEFDNHVGLIYEDEKTRREKALISWRRLRAALSPTPAPQAERGKAHVCLCGSYGHSTPQQCADAMRNQIPSKEDKK